MIVDKLENISRYALMIKDCQELDRFFIEHPLKDLAPGRYTPEGTGLIITVFDYETKIGSKTPWETHHSHMDIHIVITGCEDDVNIHVGMMGFPHGYSHRHHWL